MEKNHPRLSVLDSAGTDLIFTTSWLGWPKQPIKWAILYHVMSCSVFKWWTGWGRGFLLLRSKLSIGWWEHCMMYMLFLSIIDCRFFSPFAILLNCSHPNPWDFCLFLSFWFSSPSHRGGGRSERVTAWFFVANWGKITTISQYHTLVDKGGKSKFILLGQNSEYLNMIFCDMRKTLYNPCYFTQVFVWCCFLIYFYFCRACTWMQHESFYCFEEFELQIDYLFICIDTFWIALMMT